MVDKIGLVGLAVMGQNLVLNMEEKGFEVVVYNRTTEKAEKFVRQNHGKNIDLARTTEELVQNLEPPRVILMMVKAGKAVDAVIGQLTPLLEKGDTLIDGGNSYFKDTERRSKELAEKGINFLGVGISGGEEGARYGPSIMPGGQEESYSHIKDILEKIAAQVDEEPCCTYLGPRSAGHFVKMVHNGIEYAIMQGIAEVYSLMLELEISYPQMKECFGKWAKSEKLGSFLTEITADILGEVDEKTGKTLLEVIKDKAGSKGTGKWTSQTAYDYGVPVHNISAALLARIISSYKEKREESDIDFEKKTVSLNEEQLAEALYSVVVMSYAQGFHLLKIASDELDYNLNLKDIARIWRGGCIIRSKLLQPIMEAFDNGAENLMDAFDLKESTLKLREVTKAAISMGIPVPVLSSSLAYYDSYREGRLPSAAMIQAQRDFFGAHTYERLDEEGVFHTLWSGDRSEVKR